MRKEILNSIEKYSEFYELNELPLFISNLMCWFYIKLTFLLIVCLCNGKLSIYSLCTGQLMFVFVLGS